MGVGGSGDSKFFDAAAMAAERQRYLEQQAAREADQQDEPVDVDGGEQPSVTGGDAGTVEVAGDQEKSGVEGAGVAEGKRKPGTGRGRKKKEKDVPEVVEVEDDGEEEEEDRGISLRVRLPESEYCLLKLLSMVRGQSVSSCISDLVSGFIKENRKSLMLPAIEIFEKKKNKKKQGGFSTD